MMPCRPPIAFCSTVGHAIVHTARAIGPSTMDRSNRRPAGTAGAADPAGADALVASSAGDPAGASVLGDAVGFKADDHSKLLGLLQDPADFGVRDDDGWLTLQGFVVSLGEILVRLRR